MSERKVLNKYYPPDFDPSKIPKVKGNRNATFIIRVMAPCNMRCTTCGEYIYKVQIAFKKKSFCNNFSLREENSMREKKMWTTWIILGSEYTGKSKSTICLLSYDYTRFYITTRFPSFDFSRVDIKFL